MFTHTRKLALIAGLGLGLITTLAHADFLPNLPIEEVGTDDPWVCDLESLELYLTEDEAYYVSPDTGSLVPIGSGQELILGLDTRSWTTLTVHVPSDHNLGYSVDGGETSIRSARGPVNVIIPDNGSTYQIAPLAEPTGASGGDISTLPSKGKVTIQSHDDCPPPKTEH